MVIDKGKVQRIDFSVHFSFLSEKLGFGQNPRGNCHWASRIILSGQKRPIVSTTCVLGLAGTVKSAGIITRGIVLP